MAKRATDHKCESDTAAAARVVPPALSLWCVVELVRGEAWRVKGVGDHTPVEV